MSKPYRLPLYKRLLDKEWFRSILTFLISLCVRFLYYTSRIEWRIDESAAPYIRSEKPAIYNFWHGRLLLMPWTASRKRPIHGLVSQHRDGALIAETVRWLGIRTVRGSSSKGARAGLRQMLEKAAAGESLAITPDGPRGPYQVAAPGAVWVARMSGLPMLLLTYSSTRRRHLKSWDKFLLPLPFGRVIMRVTGPMFVPADADNETMERLRLELETRLRTLTEELDAELTT